MTFPYGTVLRDVTDGEVVMVVRSHRESAAFWDVVVLVPSDRSAREMPVGEVAYRAVDLPQWERLP